MDPKWFGAVFIILLFLGGCGVKEAAVDEPEVAAEVVEEKEKAVQLSVEEAQEIVEKNMAEIRQQLQDLQNENTDWFHQEWIFEPETDRDQYEKGEALVKERLSSLVTEKGLDLKVRLWMMSNWCECDSMAVESLYWDHGINYQLNEQKEDRFIISYFLMHYDYAFSLGKRNLEYIKEDGKWKLNHAEIISPEEESIELTFEDVQALLEYIYGDEENVELTEETDRYIIVKMGESYWAVHKSEGSFNFEVAEKYEESAEPEVETPVEEPVIEEELELEEEDEPEPVKSGEAEGEISKFAGLWEEPGRSEEAPFMMVKIQNVQGNTAHVQVDYMSAGGRQIASSDGQVVFEDGAGTFGYEEDGWEGTGEMRIDLTEEGPVVKVNVHKDGEFWGFIEGTFKVTKRAE